MKDYLITRNGIEPLTETQAAIWKAIDKGMITYEDLIFEIYGLTKFNRVKRNALVQILRGQIVRLNKKLKTSKIESYMGIGFRYVSEEELKKRGGLW